MIENLRSVVDRVGQSLSQEPLVGGQSISAVSPSWTIKPPLLPNTQIPADVSTVP